MIRDAGRYDHILPQCYLRGFIHPRREQLPKPLWVLLRGEHQWSEKSPRKFGGMSGFYDYAPGASPDQTAEEAFGALENQFSGVRTRIRNDGFATWFRDRDTLISFASMLAVRSNLFRKQAVASIHPSLAARDASRADELAKNYSITLLRTEMVRRTKQWTGYNWCLGYSVDPDCPFITSDQPVTMRSNRISQAEALVTNDFLLCCPISWDMCLFGSVVGLPVMTRRMERQSIVEMWRQVVAQAESFVVSPLPLEADSLAAGSTSSIR